MTDKQIVVLTWHYTTGQTFQQIEEDGLLRPTRKLIDSQEKPALWFSRHPDWEPTACKNWVNPDGTMMFLDKKATCDHCGGLVRFGIPKSDPRLISWNKFQCDSGITSKTAKRLEKAARANGSFPLNWSASFSEIPIKELLVDVYVPAEERWERAS